jgi:hypothetical protein
MYADLIEEDGAIITSDQEKVYNKIQHTYLFETLEAFHLPPLFVNMVRNLYKSAYTQVVINGSLSSLFQVTRGVCQGNPPSCLLFDLAIEPLVYTIWNSPNINGFKIPGLNDRIVVNIYADDTTIYLLLKDRYSDLENILKEWCMASEAKFNLEKMEIQSIGTKLHREQVVQQRKLNDLDEP